MTGKNWEKIMRYVSLPIYCHHASIENKWHFMVLYSVVLFLFLLLLMNKQWWFFRNYFSFCFWSMGILSWLKWKMELTLNFTKMNRPKTNLLHLITFIPWIFNRLLRLRIKILDDCCTLFMLDKHCLSNDTKRLTLEYFFFLFFVVVLAIGIGILILSGNCLQTRFF